MPPKTPPPPTLADAPSRRVPPSVLAALVLILAVAAALRLHGLTRESLWLDELWTATMSGAPTLRAVLTEGRLPRDVHPPLFYVIEHTVIRCFGDSEVALRFPSVLAGTLAVFAVWLLGRRLYGDAEGLVGAALTAALLAPVSYSQEARTNIMLVLFATVSAYFWVSQAEALVRGGAPRARDSACYALSAAALAMLHYFAAGLVILQALVLLVLAAVRRPRRIPFVALLYLPTAVAYFLWLSVILGVRRPASGSGPMPSAMSVLGFCDWALGPHGAWLTFAALALVVAALVRDVGLRRPATPDAAAQETPAAAATALLALWLLLPLATAWAAPRLGLMIGIDRFILYRSILFCLPPLYLLIARAAAWVPMRGWVLASAATAVLALLVFVLVGPSRYYAQAAKDQFREAVGYVVEHDRDYPRSMIVAWVRNSGPPLYDYYFRRLGSTRRTDAALVSEQQIDAFASYLRSTRPDYVWLVWAHYECAPQVLEFMDRSYTRVDSKDFLRAGVRLYCNVPP